MITIADLNEFYSRGLNDFQLQEVKDGLKSLTIEQVNIYAWPKYDHLQMQEIRLALETGLSEKEIEVFLDPDIDWQAMNHARIKLTNTNAVSETAAAKLHMKRLQIVLLAIVIIICLCGAGYGGSYAIRYFQAVSQNLVLDLSDSEVTIEYAAAFNPMDYVKDYTHADGVVLTIPETIDTHVLGTVTVLYQLSNAYRSISKDLKVTIIDSTAPVINLTTQEATLTRGEDPFSCKAFLSSAEDSVDGDLTDQVMCSSADESKDDQTITYSVTDSSGNEGTAALALHFKDPEPDPEPIIIYQPVPGGNSGGSSSGGVSPPAQHGSQTFMFSQGYDMDSGYQACIAAGSAYGAFSCQPIMEDGIYTGYQLTY